MFGGYFTEVVFGESPYDGIRFGARGVFYLYLLAVAGVEDHAGSLKSVKVVFMDAHWVGSWACRRVGMMVGVIPA